MIRELDADARFNGRPGEEASYWQSHLAELRLAARDDVGDVEKKTSGGGDAAQPSLSYHKVSFSGLMRKFMATFKSCFSEIFIL